MINDQIRKKHKRIKGVPVAYESICELSRLIDFLKGKGYTGYVERSGLKVVYLDNSSKQYFSTNVTCMACWCSGKRYPLSVDQFIENYVRVVTDDDADLYNELTRRRYEERLCSKRK